MERAVITIRRMTLGSGFDYLMRSVATADGATVSSGGLASYYADSGTPPGIFLGAGLASLGEGAGVPPGSVVSEEQLWRMLGMCADPLTGLPLGQAPNRSQRSLATRIKERIGAISASLSDAERTELIASITTEEEARQPNLRPPVAGFDLTFSPSKSISVAWALADEETRKVIVDCHRRAIDDVLAYAEQEVSFSRSGPQGIIQEDVEGVVAADLHPLGQPERRPPAP